MYYYGPHQECLINNNLQTAATYLIILQNLEKPIVSRQVNEEANFLDFFLYIIVYPCFPNGFYCAIFVFKHNLGYWCADFFKKLSQCMYSIFLIG